MKSNVADRVKEQVEQIKGAYGQGKESARDLTQTATVKSKEAAYRADEWIHDNSWKMLGITLAVGLILGLILRGSDHEMDLERYPR